MDWFTDVEVIIFDVDGTLYQEETIVSRYLAYILEGKVIEQAHEKIIEEAYAILHGQHAVKIGKIYDRRTKLLYDHTALKIHTPQDWNGEKLDAAKPQNKDLMSIGDAWEVAKIVGLYYGATEKEHQKAIINVRKDWLREQESVFLQPQLAAAIDALNVKKKMVVTNTAMESGQACLEAIGVSELFDTIKYSGNKPLGIYELLQDLQAEGYRPDQILAVGDNGFNDLYPASVLGARTLYVSHYPSVNHPDWDLTVPSLAELAGVLGEIADWKMEKTIVKQGSSS